METNPRKNNSGFTGTARLLVSLFIGIAVGALLYARFWGTNAEQPDSEAMATESDKAPAAPVPSSITKISSESQREVGIVVEPAALRSLQSTLSATGTVCEDPGRVVHIRPLARGLLEKIYVQLGDRVSAGDPLIEYDNIELGLASKEYLSAQNELQRILTDLEVKKKILERSREMLRQGAIAQITHDLREAEYKDAEARVAGARSAVSKIAEELRRYGWTDRDLADLPSKGEIFDHRISHEILRAPFSGVVTSYHAAEGEVVEPSAELITITDLSQVWILADVYEKDLSHIRTGKNVSVRVPAYPGRVFEGKIVHVADALDPKSRTAKVRCLVQNHGGLLKLEMFATIELPTEKTDSVVSVPASSLQQMDSEPVVFVRRSETEFEMRAVQAGVENQGFVEIRSGLKPGELVASRGSFVLKTAFLQHLIGE
jgi:cobalt-zinc-cadmium efflux system membrane fusion protein